MWKENSRSEVLSCLRGMADSKESNSKSKKEEFLEFQKSKLEGMTVGKGAVAEE